MMILRVSLVCLALASAACAVSLNKRETAKKAPEVRADYSPPSYGGGGGGGGGGGAAHGSGGSHYGGDQGNLYYYYYPVQEHAGYQTTAGREDDFSGLLGILLPLFIICCCCLLVIPLFSSGVIIDTGSGRKKRSDGQPDLPYRDAIGELKSELDRLFFLYLNAVESEQCPERIFCEVGTYAGTFSGKDFIFRMIDTFDIIPDAFKSKFRVMEKAALTGKDMTICKKYLCHPPKLINRN